MSNQSQPSNPVAAASAPLAPAVMAAQPAGTQPRISSTQLLQRGPELEIEHEGGIYRLRRTAAGKLILTK